MKWRTPRSERFRGKFRCLSRAKVGARATPPRLFCSRRIGTRRTRLAAHQPHSQGLLRFHLESGVDPGNEVTYETQNKTTQMRPKQSRAILIFLITPTTTRLFADYPYTTGTQKAARISNKNSFFNWVHSLHKELMNASHSTNLFSNSCNHISTNGKAPLHSPINHNTPQFLYSH